MMSTTNEVVPARKPRRKAWETPALKPMGSISEVLQTGGAKPSTASGDPGEPRKVASKG